MKYFIGVVVLSLLIGGAVLVVNRNKSSSNQSSMSTGENVAPTTGEPKIITPTQPGTFQTNAKRIATNYYQYSKKDYEAAKAQRHPIYLYFYANWCPTCAKQEPQNVTMFNDTGKQEKYQDFVAFRVNFNDSDTDKDEEALAKEFGVTYQHTMFVLDRNGQQIKKFLGQTSVDAHKTAFDAAL